MSNTTHLDILNIVFLIPLFCIIYSMMDIWLYNHHENHEDRDEKHLKN
jgi:hypothetical protein